MLLIVIIDDVVLEEAHPQMAEVPVGRRFEGDHLKQSEVSINRVVHISEQVDDHAQTWTRAGWQIWVSCM